MREVLHAAFHEPKTRIYRVVDATVWVLIIVSIVLLGLEEFFPPESTAGRLLRSFDIVLLVFFALEVTLRIATYRPAALKIFDRPPLGKLRTHLVGRLRYMMRPLILVDILTVLALVPALRGLRALRLLRLLRTVRVFRYANPFSGLVHAFENDRLLFAFAGTVLATETLIGGISIYFVESGAPGTEIHSVADALWWALVTITTVGFGDITPVTGLGRVVGSALMVGGMFTLALFAGIVGHSLLNAVLSIREEQFRMSDYVNHMVVCGYEHGESMLLDVLNGGLDAGNNRVVLFSPGARPADVPPEFLWVTGDPTKESELDKVRITHASTVVIAGQRSLGPQQSDAVSILTAFTIRSYLSKHATTDTRKKPLQVIIEILDSENVEHAQAAGADEVVETRRVGYSLMANSVLFPGVGRAMSDIVFNRDQNLYVGSIPEDLQLGGSFDELSDAVRQRNGALVIGLRDPASGEEWVNPAATQLVRNDLQLIYLAPSPVLGTQ